MDTESLVETLKTAGLSPYQADAYVALLDLGTAPATDVADASDVPAPRIYDVLRSLEDRGYIETFEQASLRARAHSPSTVLEDLTERADRLERAAQEVEKRWEQPELEAGDASIVTRFQTVISRAKSFIASASHQVLLSTTIENFEQLRPALQDAMDRGVSVRVSVHTSDEAVSLDADRFAGLCTEVHHRPLPAPFVALADRRRACFAHHPDSYDRYGVLVNDRTHTYVFYWYFLTCLWEPWERVYQARDDGYPIEYFDVRHLVRDLRDVDWEDDPVRLRVEGYDTNTGEECHLEGTITDVRVPFDAEAATGFELAGQVTVDLDVDGEHVSVGGWGAIIEDVEGTRLTVVK
ncbi:TrmB family transcriptional regulator [Halobellus limi]|jgi:sugar-specific transcriptional regulator TrmB|uniref:Sugar-specific transcriptional regulator TrmB n=1 Tax=Halobellus limi TaxID=699433 RepID=A0A1H6C3K2_9EURY|nr:TrmB family transcriptional regulator [Halobellus limi]QCC48592.1 TrmB family transcriptional regulator [Halobellus limi]SEG67580.1 Sugar-specific transcriptional regulator TrmB [Halobellus limi]